ncbi:MAG: 1-(5-phosphoribosyl)-5-[(5-phosphoribosylamino)methylideneamino] imidazole-4-carboxamide isomerase [Longimicrobiales bacterium]|nr:1-(5-phosphoribosyl)-5-[(5-phosphoribosylamino)methylideneamino] imidazole-4-carboxamide isomerase [Longimicrobiales bacterium]
MIAVPAVDLRGGRCVQLVGGRPEDERVSLPDPPAVARAWWERGFGALHVVDLDAALGTGHNRAVIADVASASPADTQVGGGVRDEAAVAALLALGVSRVVVGTRAVDDPAWLAETARRHPGRLTVAADVRDGVVLRKGWTEGTGLRLDDLLATLADLPLAGVLCTDVGREGQMEGIDRAAVARALAASPHPMWISGGVTTLEELEYLAGAGAAGVVLGMALYTGRLDAVAVARRWGGAGPAAGTTPETPDPGRNA